MFSAQKEELPNPFHHCFTFKVKDKTDVTMKLSGRLLAAVWIPGSFRRTTWKLFLGKNFLQLEGYFVPAQIKHLAGNFCNPHGKIIEILISPIGLLKAIQHSSEISYEANPFLLWKL